MVRIISKSGYTTTLSSFVVVMLHFTLDRALPQCGEIVPVLSLPARVVNTAICLNTPEAGPDTACVDRQEVNVVYARVLQLCRTVHATCVRQLPISLPGGSAPAVTAEVEEREKERESFCAYALESPGYLGIAGKVWDSMYVLLQYLSLHSEELVSGKRIIELGCGTGLAGKCTLLSC